MADKLLVNNVTTQQLTDLVTNSGLVEGLQYKNTETGKTYIATGVNTYTMMLDAGQHAAPVYIKTIEISHEEILTLPTVHVDLVEPIGLGKVIIPVNMIVYASYPTTSYENMSVGCTMGIPFSEWGSLDSNSFIIINASSAPIFDGPAIGTDPWLLFASSGFNLGDQKTIQFPQNFLSNVSNEALVLKCSNAGGNFTGGSPENKLIIKLFYYIVDFS
jgi:hypothetical protein